ncbi:P-loop containing nucleoside triphosphate hydrolase protein [Hypoxylon sp. FL1284]|nr:P-loop containing nucleoside triphosphate hydrolase protein [Hypoxylon sp. FL1284]
MKTAGAERAFKPAQPAACTLVVLGPKNVGKTAMIEKWCQGNAYDPKIPDPYRTQVKLENQAYAVEVLDPAGGIESAKSRQELIHRGRAFLLVYSILSSNFFHETEELCKELFAATQSTELTQPRVPIVVVGNKSDQHIRRRVPIYHGYELAKLLQCPFYETSAEEGRVKEPFLELARAVIAQTSTKDPDAAGRDNGREHRDCSCIFM